MMTKEVYLETAKNLYQQDDDYYFSAYDYQPILDHFGKILIQVDDDDYQGDSRVLYDDTGKGFGYLNFGWGSCSGCDALQAASTFEDVAEIIESLDGSIKWASREDLLKFFKEHDWKGDYSWHEEGQREFIKKVVEYLENK